MKLSDVNLTLFFTGGVGLKTWAEIGSLDREIAIYQQLTKHLKAVNFITYGGEADRAYSARTGKIGVYPTLWGPSTAKILCRLLLHRWKVLMQSNILKTNQIGGSEIPVWLKKRFGKKLIVRCGYLPGRFTELQGYDQKTVAAAKCSEQKAFEAADICVVPNVRDRDWVVKTYGIPADKLRIIPNYADGETFKPLKDKRDIQFDVVYVGRSGPQKNLLALLEALALLKSRGRHVRLLLIGGCITDETLKRTAEAERLDVIFHGNVPNTELPQYLLQAFAYILPSYYEGQPKVLLEAMSCALPCIGSDVEGIRELIHHRQTGYLCNTDAKSMADAIEIVLSDEPLRRRMGENARRYITENYTLERVLKMELDVIREVIST